MAIKTKKVLPKTHGTNNTITSTIDTTGGGSIQLPTTGNNGTGGLYGQFTPTMGNTGGISIVGSNNAPTAPVGAGSLQPITIGGNGAGGAYGDFLTPTLPTTPTNPVYTPIIGGVVGTVGGGFSGGNKGGVTDEGVITGRLPNADDVTFDNGGTTTGTGAGAGTSTGDSTPTDTKPETAETSTMTYEQYIAEQKAREEEKRQAALKEAEIYKERAAADAQASYMQNMSTYGVNAETMAQMGLTGGGYSDYLNAQAYAQKRGEMQTASANEAAMKQRAESKYADNILSLDGQLVAYKEAEKAEKEQYAKSVYNTLWEAVQNPNTTYTADSIKAIAEKAGISKTDITTLTGMLDSTLAKKAEDDKKVEEEKTATEKEEKATYSAGLKSEAMATIEANGGMSVEYINSLKGYGLSDEDMAEVVTYNQKYTYNSYKSAITGGYTVNTSDIDTAYNDGLLDETQYNSLKTEWNKSIDTSTSFFRYNGSIIDFEDAKTALKEVSNNSWCTEETKKKLQSSYMRAYAVEIAKEKLDTDYTSTVVDINSSGYKPSQWGDFEDISESNSKQGKYVATLIADAKAGKIKVGQVISINYGSVLSDYGCYVYIGDGVFVKCDMGFFEDLNKYNNELYIPSGYKRGGINDSVREK